MSFFRNIRSSISRRKNSSRESTPVVNRLSRSASVNSPNESDSINSRPGGLSRSDTFTFEGETDYNSTTTSTSSKKCTVLSKFSTFTKRKKSQSPVNPPNDYLPSEQSQNTYYKWRSSTSDAMGSIDYDSDPFNFLYEQQSSLKSKNDSSTSVPPSPALDMRRSAPIDSSTYKKSRTPGHLCNQLDQLKNTPKMTEEMENKSDREKYKTVTLNSFRRSFREKFLAQQNEVPHNPSWFVEVEPPATDCDASKSQRESKENRPDFLVFENEHYRPESRSPVRDNKSGSPLNVRGRRRTEARSPVKRNETFRVEHHPPAKTNTKDVGESMTTFHQQPSISIEIKNSIIPNQPGRMVPVGVAKPMLANVSRNPKRYSNDPTQSYHIAATEKPISPPIPVAARNSTISSGRYQTYIQIRNDSKAPASKLPTRIHITGTPPTQSTASKRVGVGNTSRYIPANIPLSSYEVLKSSALSRNQPQANPTTTSTKPKQTYFGDNYQYQRIVDYSGDSCSRKPNLQHQQQPKVTTAGYMSQRDHNRISVPALAQRRARSPIKMPWR